MPTFVVSLAQAQQELEEMRALVGNSVVVHRATNQNLPWSNSHGSQRTRVEQVVAAAA